MSAAACAAGVNDTDLRARVAHLVSRSWPIERLVKLCHAWLAGEPVDAIGKRFGLDTNALHWARRRLFESGIIAPRWRPWTPERVDEYCALYDQGLSHPEIGRRLGITPSASIGKSHRLIDEGRIAPREKHPGNLSPEEKARRKAAALTAQEARRRRTEHQREMRQARAAERTEQRAARPAPGSRTIPIARLRPEPKPALPKAAERQAYTPPPRVGRTIDCCWPIGEPGTPAFRFCDAASEPGRPYCCKHVGKAYVKTPRLAAREARV